jgi:phage terminase large subunit GpA-like protein
MSLAYLDAFRAGLQPDPYLTVSEWADEHRMLSQKAASEPGPWRTARTPYLREIQDSLSPSSSIQRVVFMAGAQVGKTETGNNWMGFIVHHAPGPMMIVQPTVDTAKRLSKQRLAPMIEETPCLRERIAESRSRDSGNTMMVKEFQGGVIVLTGANSAVGLRSMPVRYLFLDEVDAFPQDVDGEGDPVNLAERRTTTFSRRKIYLSSTPTIKDVSRIEREYLASDQRRYFVPCPHCDHMQWLRWPQMKWSDGNPASAMYACEACGVLIEERFKAQMLRNGGWIATADGDGKTAGFHLSSLYSPLGWKSWASIVEDFLAAKNDPPSLKTWVNTVLGETWEESFSAKVSSSQIAERAEVYDLLSVPEGGLLLTAGVDVQDNRVAIVVRAWGEDEESWLVNHAEIYGDPARPELWRQLDSVLFDTEYTHESGAPMPVRAVAIDTGGHFTHEVYAYARTRRDRHVIAIKGMSQPGKPIIGKPSKQDINFKGQTIKKGVELWGVGTDTAKATIYGRLKNTDEQGAGVYHWPLGLPAEYFEQLTAEKQVTRYANGHPKRLWVKKDGARNEALDCEVYALAALQYFYTRTNRATLWKTLRGKLGAPSRPAPQITANEPEPPKAQPVIRRTTIQPRRPGGGFVKGFR